MNAHGRAEEEQVTGQLNHSGGLQGHTFVSMYAEKNLLRRTAFLITVPGKIIGSFFLPYCASCGKVRKYIITDARYILVCRCPLVLFSAEQGAGSLHTASPRLLPALQAPPDPANGGASAP